MPESGDVEEGGEMEGDCDGGDDDGNDDGDGAKVLGGLGLEPAWDGFLPPLPLSPPRTPPTTTGLGVTVIPPSGIVTGALSTIIRPGSDERRIQLEE